MVEMHLQKVLPKGSSMTKLLIVKAKVAGGNTTDKRKLEPMIMDGQLRINLPAIPICSYMNITCIT